MSNPRIALILLLAMILLIIAGPRASVEDTWTEIEVGEDIDSWLESRERTVPEVESDKKKGVTWFGGMGQKTRYSVVYLHGFSASRLESRPFSDSLAMRLEANLLYTRLEGHGQPGTYLGESKASDWLQDTAEAIRVGEAIGDSIIVVGLSTGATLAAWAAAKPTLSQKMAAQIWVSPNFGPKNPQSEMLLWPWGRTLMHIVQGDEYEWTPQNQLHANIGTQRYGSDALLEMMALVDLARGVSFESVSIPTLLIYSPTDTVVDADQTVEIWDRLVSRKDSIQIRTALDKNNHVIIGDALGPTNTKPMVRATQSFVTRH